MTPSTLKREPRPSGSPFVGAWFRPQRLKLRAGLRSWPGRRCSLGDQHSRRRTTMRKLIESTLVSLDGVTEAPERWANFDAEDTALSLEQLGNYDPFVMGRVAYVKFFPNWGQSTVDPYIDLISDIHKYV